METSTFLSGNVKSNFVAFFDLPQLEVEKRREEQRNFGVFFDDDYDYLQHLKEASGQSELVAAGPSHADRQAFKLHDDEEDEDEGDMDTAAVPVSRPSVVEKCVFKSWKR